MQKKIRVGAVSYLNTKPLIYGFEQGMMQQDIELSLHYPSQLTSLMQKQQLDIALLPVASIQNVNNANVFSNFCIASDHKVASVCLFSYVPIEEIQEVFLDYQSRTSVTLFKMLMRDYWNIRPSLLEADASFISSIKNKSAGIVIGDRALDMLNEFPYVYDLAEAWRSHTQLPFVFATWVTQTELSQSFIHDFNEANQLGFMHIDTIIKEYGSATKYDLNTYYTHNIAYQLTEERRNGMQLFLRKVEAL
jgi:chorismate dehydratase